MECKSKSDEQAGHEADEYKVALQVLQADLHVFTCKMCRSNEVKAARSLQQLHGMALHSGQQALLA